MTSYEQAASGLYLPVRKEPPPPSPPAWDNREASRQRSELTHRIYETPCPGCGGKLQFSEHTIGTIGVFDPDSLWEFCNRHTFPCCANGCKVSFEEVIPRPSRPTSSPG